MGCQGFFPQHSALFEALFLGQGPFPAHFSWARASALWPPGSQLQLVCRQQDPLTFTLIFFSLPFWKTARKTTKKTRISSACRTPKILGKKRGETLKIARNSLKRKKVRKTKKARKRRLGQWLHRRKSASGVTMCYDSQLHPINAGKQ